MVRVRIKHPSLRAVVAGSARSKKIQVCPPFPERERSRAAGTLSSWQVSRKARESYSQVFLSKSAARNQHVSSGRRGIRQRFPCPGGGSRRRRRSSGGISVSCGRLSSAPL